MPDVKTFYPGATAGNTINNSTVTVAAALIEGTNQTLTITNNQAIRLVYINASFGWLIT